MCVPIRASQWRDTAVQEGEVKTAPWEREAFHCIGRQGTICGQGGGGRCRTLASRDLGSVAWALTSVIKRCGSGRLKPAVGTPQACTSLLAEGPAGIYLSPRCASQSVPEH